MFDQTCKLISETETINQYGDIETVSVEREVFCEEKSVGMTEKYQAQSLGLKPEIKLVLSDYLDYQNEETIKYQEFGMTEEKTYQVLRTFRNGLQLEITLQGMVNAHVSTTVGS